MTVYTGLVGTTGSTSAIPFLTNAPVMVHRATILDSSSPGDFMVTVDSTEVRLVCCSCAIFYLLFLLPCCVVCRSSYRR